VSRSTRRPFNRKRKSDLIGRVPDIRSGTLTPAMSAHGWRHSRARPRVRGLAREGLATSIAAAPLMPATASKRERSPSTPPSLRSRNRLWAMSQSCWQGQDAMKEQEAPQSAPPACFLVGRSANAARRKAR
jgi:hypothetical protein